MHSVLFLLNVRKFHYFKLISIKPQSTMSMAIFKVPQDNFMLMLLIVDFKPQTLCWKWLLFSLAANTQRILNFQTAWHRLMLVSCLLWARPKAKIVSFSSDPLSLVLGFTESSCWEKVLAKNSPRIDALQEVQPAQMQFAQMKQVQEGDGGQLGKAIAAQVQIGEVREFRELLCRHHLQ